MFDGEPFVLQAVLSRIQTSLGLPDSQCSIEADDDFVPQSAGDVYVTVTPAGMTPGPVHQSSGGVRDVEYSVRVAVFLRSRTTPRDQRRHLFLNQVAGINKYLSDIVKAIDWRIEVTNAANTLLYAVSPTDKGFLGMLRMVSIDAKPRGIAVDVYGAGSMQGGQGADTQAGVTRGVTFGRLRRLEYVS